MTITRDLLIALAIYNAGVDRSRRAYRADQGYDTDYTPAALHAAANRRYRKRNRP